MSNGNPGNSAAFRLPEATKRLPPFMLKARFRLIEKRESRN
jgi:hypothetical protein